MIAAIVRGDNRINIPDGEAILFPSDRIEAIGSDDSLQRFQQRLQSELFCQTPDTNHLQLRRLLIREGNPLIGLALRDSGIRADYHCMVVGFEASDGSIVPATAERIIVRNDVVWMVGEDDHLRRLRSALADGNVS